MSAERTTDVPSVEEIRETLDMLDSWEDRFSYVIDLGRKVPDLSERERVDANLVKGCQAQVWLVADTDDGERLRLRARSDSQLVNGLIAIVLALYDGAPVREVPSINAEKVIVSMGLEEHLSPTRRNGLHAMIERIRTIGRAASGTN